MIREFYDHFSKPAYLSIVFIVAEHRLEEDEAAEVARDLTYTLVKHAYRFD